LSLAQGGRLRSGPNILALALDANLWIVLALAQSASYLIAVH